MLNYTTQIIYFISSGIFRYYLLFVPQNNLLDFNTYSARICDKKRVQNTDFYLLDKLLTFMKLKYRFNIKLDFLKSIIHVTDLKTELLSSIITVLKLIFSVDRLHPFPPLSIK